MKLKSRTWVKGTGCDRCGFTAGAFIASMKVGDEYLCARHFRGGRLGAEEISEEEHIEELRAREKEVVAQLIEIAARVGDNRCCA